MKNKLTIKNAQGEYLQHVIFEEQSIQDNFIQMLADSVPWGSDYSIEMQDVSLEINQQEINQQAEAYLKETDFYIIRMMDIGTPIPEGIQILRQQARDRIVRS